MKKILSIFLFTALSLSASAQVSHGGQPFSWQEEFTSSVEFIRLPELDMAAIAAEDAERDQYKEFGYRFGIERNVTIDPQTSGSWTTEGNRHVWRFGIHAPGAKAVSVLFTEYELPRQARVFLYDADQTHFIGSFNHTNRQANGMLATSLVYGEDVIVEVQIPTKMQPEDLQLEIGQIVHAYRGLDSEFERLTEAARGPFGTSGACNINVNCSPIADDWQVEKRSVALIVNGENAVCTGALVNNTANDGHPYFLTANHCLGGGVNNWVFYFNHESSTCGGSNGPTNQSVSGATLLANNDGSDFGLLEINNGNAIPASFNAEFAGWDNSDATSVSSAVGIHHPSGDVKKICFEEDAPYHANQSGAAVWYIDEWEDGVTEGGSSGSPLFDQNHRIIGQLYGGFAACSGSVNNGEADWYGRFGVSWDGSSASNRLRDWLDPANSGVTTLDGYPTGAVSYDYDAASGGLSGVPEIGCGIETIEPVFTLRNNGETTMTSAIITIIYNGGSAQNINWTGNLAQNQTEDVTLPPFVSQAGTNTVEVTVSQPNGETDENNTNNTVTETFDVILGEALIEVSLTTDDYGYETYWEIRGPNNQLVASGGNTNVGPNGGGDQTADESDPGAYGDNVTITENVALVGDGCYRFLIVDDFADGICCTFDNGSYTIRDVNNTILAQGGEFDEEEESQFGMIGGVSVGEITSDAYAIYPNPTEGVFFVDLGTNDPNVKEIQITDLTGRMIERISVGQQTRLSVNMSDLSEGIYYVTLLSNTDRRTEKLVHIK